MPKPALPAAIAAQAAKTDKAQAKASKDVADP
jgi:hypothetical protein